MTGGRVVWCDFGGVLTDPVIDVLDRVSTMCAVPVNVLVTAFSTVAAEFGGDGLAPLETGSIDEVEWGKRVTARLAPRWRPRADLTRFSELWYADRGFNHELCDALVLRRERGCRLAMLTNSVREWEPYRAALIPDHVVFELVVRSHELGIRKPDLEIFRLAEQRLGVSATDCVLIDDSARNCRAAELAGWQAIWHRDNASTLDRLDLILAAAT